MPLKLAIWYFIRNTPFAVALQNANNVKHHWKRLSKIFIAKKIAEKFAVNFSAKTFYSTLIAQFAT